MPSTRILKFHFSLAIFLWLGSGLGYGNALPKGNWTVTETPNAKIFTDAPDSVPQTAFEHFTILEELVLDELSEYQTASNRSLRAHYVLLPRSLSLFEDLSPIRPENENTKVAGYYLQSDFNPLILAQSSDQFGAWDTIHHEYVHRILHAHFDSVPTWADEGLAELFSTLRINKKRVRLTRSGDRTARYTASKPAFLDWGAFFATNHEELKKWIKKGLPEAQAYYAQASLFAEYTHFGNPSLRDGYWQLVERSRYKPITELDIQLLLGVSFSELDKAVRRQLKRPLSSVRARLETNAAAPLTTRPATPPETAAILSIAYSRSGKAKYAQSLLTRYQGIENPIWLAAKSETTRRLRKSTDAFAFAHQALSFNAEDPFLITFATLRLYNSKTLDEAAALASLQKAYARGDTSELMYYLHFEIADKGELPFEEFAAMAKEGVIYHPEIKYASEFLRIEAGRALAQ